MNSNQRDRCILEHIINYCDEIVKTQEFFGNSFEIFKENSIYKNAISMCLLQIGELSGHLSEDLKEKHSKVPWRNIKGIRNIMAHEYGDISVTTVWETVIEDIPVLREYCKTILQ